MTCSRLWGFLYESHSKTSGNQTQVAGKKKMQVIFQRKKKTSIRWRFPSRAMLDYQRVSNQNGKLITTYIYIIYIYIYNGGFLKWGDPQNGWFIMENPIQKWMVQGYPPFQETSIYIYHNIPFVSIVCVTYVGYPC